MEKFKLDKPLSKKENNSIEYRALRSPNSLARKNKKVHILKEKIVTIIWQMYPIKPKVERNRNLKTYTED